MIPSPAELTYFFEITKTLSVTRAAKNLYISQPALTRAIQHLENKVGAQLFIRQKNGLVLTRAGKNMLLHVKPLLEYWKTAQIEVSDCHSVVQGDIKIGCHSTLGLFIHGFMKSLIQKYPLLNIEIYTANSATISQRVIDLELDIGLVVMTERCPDLILRKVGEAETSIWVQKDFCQYDSENAVLICNPDFHRTQYILQQCKKMPFHYNRLLKVNSMEVIASLTANGCGAGILPDCFAKKWYTNKIVRVENAPIIVDPVYLVYRKEFRNVHAIKTVVSAIKDWVKDSA